MYVVCTTCYLETNHVDACAATELGKSLETQVKEGELFTLKTKESIPLFLSLLNFRLPCPYSVLRVMHDDDYCHSLFTF